MNLDAVSIEANELTKFRSWPECHLGGVDIVIQTFLFLPFFEDDKTYMHADFNQLWHSQTENGQQ